MPRVARGKESGKERGAGRGKATRTRTRKKKPVNELEPDSNCAPPPPSAHHPSCQHLNNIDINIDNPKFIIKQHGTNRTKTKTKDSARTLTPHPLIKLDSKKTALEQANEIAREHIPALLPARLVEQFPAPPPILGRSCDSNNIARLEVELFVDSRRVVI